MMESEVRWQAARRRRLDYVIQQLNDPPAIRELLRPNVEYTAYALGQLEPGLRERAQWYSAKGDTGTGFVLHSRGGLGDATFVMGDPDAVRAILRIHPGPAQTYATFQPHHGDAMRSVFQLANHLPMIRMAVTRERFNPAKGEAVTLTGLDIRRINQIYSSEGGASFYAPEHIDGGIYRGVVVDGRLVAIAGTHVVSYAERVAVVGNVFSHPLFRGRGYATIATSAVTERLFDFCDDVVLTVDPKNKPAVSAYDRLGYRESCQMIEASARRRDVIGFVSGIRRTRARVRGRRYDGEFVSVRAE